MSSNTYIFSDRYAILKREELKTLDQLNLVDTESEDTLEKVYNEQAFVLSSKNYKYQYIINPTIKYFLEQFQHEAITLKSVIHQFSQETGATTDQISKIVQPFFNRMVHQGILLKNTSTQKSLELEEQPVFEIGSVIKHYEIISLITQKRIVELYEALDQRNQHKVVIKVLRKSIIRQEQLKETLGFFRQEFNMMRQLDHPNVCRFVDYESNDEYVFGVMEYIEGISPRKIVLKPSITLNDRFHIIQQLFTSVAHLHQKELTHGDIHSSNFMISDDYTLKLIDFGFTHHAVPLADELGIEGGTAGYIPPECIHSNSFEITTQRVDYQGEVFQLGVIAYVLLYDKKPFKGLTWQTLYKKIKHFEPSFATITSKNEEIPTEIINIVQKALSKQPQNRYENAIILKEWMEKAMKSF